MHTPKLNQAKAAARRASRKHQDTDFYVLQAYREQRADGSTYPVYTYTDDEGMNTFYYGYDGPDIVAIYCCGERID